MSVNDDNSLASYSYIDDIANEQPLQLILSWYYQGLVQTKELSVTMRTTGDDKVLVIGFLLSQGIIRSLADIEQLELVEDNIAEVQLSSAVKVDWQRLSRTFVSHSGCGICGQSQLKALLVNYLPFDNSELDLFSVHQLLSLPNLLVQQQTLFAQTGGCHGAAFWQKNESFIVKEDVGRHNAVDKVIGELLTRQEIARNRLFKGVLILSGRVSFELVQKAIVSRIATIIAIGAPSDLAVLTAKQFNMTLVGFTKKDSLNIYSGKQRISGLNPLELKSNGNEL